LSTTQGFGPFSVENMVVNRAEGLAPTKVDMLDREKETQRKRKESERERERERGAGRRGFGRSLYRS